MRLLIVCLRADLFACTPQMQYSFIYQALLEYYLYGDTELDVSSLEGHLHKLHNTFANGVRVGLEEEFKVYCTLWPLKDQTISHLMKTSSLLHCRKLRNKGLVLITIQFDSIPVA